MSRQTCGKMSRMNAVKITIKSRIEGIVQLPGDKSSSHRAAMFAAIADGASRIGNFASSADCASTLQCIEKLGVRIERDGPNVIIHGVGKNGLQQPDLEMDCGN